MKGFELEIENNSIKSRSGIYITENLKYTRKRNLEGKDLHLVIIDFEENSEIKRIINIYRCFNPNGNVNPREKFKYQLNSIKNAMIPKTVLLGDFNLDYEKIYEDSYAHNSPIWNNVWHIDNLRINPFETKNYLLSEFY